MRNQYEEQLRQLNESLTEMGDLCEAAIGKVNEALKAGHQAVVSEIYDLEMEVDEKEREIESLCLKLILQQQPVARDLRQISSALKMISDMERIGDQCSDITDIIKFLEKHGEMELETHVHLEAMANAARAMVTKAVSAYVNQDLELAREVMASDDKVDGLFDEVKNELIALIAQHPDEGEACLDLLMVAKYLERIGDYTTNTAEWVEFAITGTRPETD